MEHRPRPHRAGMDTVNHDKVVATLRRLTHASNRYRNAAQRNPNAASVPHLLTVCTATIREAFQGGATFHEVARAAGFTEDLS